MVGLSSDLQFASEIGTIQFVPFLEDLLVNSSNLDL
jgi:hypothetical protein